MVQPADRAAAHVFGRESGSSICRLLDDRRLMFWDAIASFCLAFIMAVLAALGFRHARRTPTAPLLPPESIQARRATRAASSTTRPSARSRRAAGTAS